MFKAINRMPDDWVRRERIGSGYRCSVTERGQQIVDGRVAVRVVGSQLRNASVAIELNRERIT
jgi:hypothetical protein